MDEALKALIEKQNGRKGWGDDFSASEIDEIYRLARQEAIAEVKSVLRAHMVHSLIEKILDSDSLPDSDVSVEEVVNLDLNPTRAEIEMIRKKISENEQLLQQIKTPLDRDSAPVQPLEPRTASDELSEDQHGSAASVGYYVFGVIENHGVVSNGPSAPSLLDGVSNLGYPVYTLAFQDIQAVLCQVPLSEFEESALKNNLNNPAWLETNVLGHQSVLQALTSSGPVIPMKFCTIYLSEARVLEALAEHHSDFVIILQTIKDKQEWGVKLFCDQCELTEQVKQSNPRLQEIQAGIAKKSEGVAYFARKKLEVATSEEVERFSDQVAQACHDRLTACAFHSCITPLQSTEVTGRTDEMVLNGAYLIEDEKIGLFQAELDSLKNLYTPSGFNFELSGPWPPYNFVAIEAKENHAHD